MIDPAVLWTIGIAIVVLPFAVTYAMNGRNQSDARGRRVSTRWGGRSLLPQGGAVALGHHDVRTAHGDGHDEVGPQDESATHHQEAEPADGAESADGAAAAH